MFFAVKGVVSANTAWVPPRGFWALRYMFVLFMIGTGNTVGVKPSHTYEFRIGLQFGVILL